MKRDAAVYLRRFLRPWGRNRDFVDICREDFEGFQRKPLTAGEKYTTMCIENTNIGSHNRKIKENTIE